MLSLHKRKRVILPATVIVAILVPAMVFAVNKIIGTNNTSAVTYQIPSGYTTITDPYFYDCVADRFKAYFPNEAIPSSGLTDQQLAKIPQLSSGLCNGTGKSDSEKITNVKGLEKMTGLNYLNIGNNKISSIDLSHNTALEVAYIGNNPFSSLDVSKNTALQQLSVSNTNLAFLDISHNTQLNNVTLGDFYVKTSAHAVQSGSNYILDLSGLKWLTGKQNVGNMNPHTIENTENYTYNSDTNVVTINNVASSGGYINVRQYPTGNYKLWIANTLGFNANGGTGSVTSQSCPVGADSCSVTIPNETPTRGDWQFLGWADSADATTATYHPGDRITLVSTKTLYAVWAGGYVVSYEYNYPGSTYHNTPQIQECVVSSSVSTCEIVINQDLGWTQTGGNDYWAFIGWAESANATTAKYQKGDTITLSGDKTLYAVWTSAYGLRLLPDDHTGGWLSVCIPSGEGCEIEVPDFNDKANSYNYMFDKDGYIVIGWADSPNATVATYSYQEARTMTLTENKDLYAVYGPTYTLSFELNKDGAVMTGPAKKKCMTSGQACDIEITSYGWNNSEDFPFIFKGWAESANATVAQYQKGDTIRVSSNKTLYGVWAPAYVLVYDCNGFESGYPMCRITTSINNDKCEISGGKCDITISPSAYLYNSDYSRNHDYTFLGWAESANATEGTYNRLDTVTLTGNKTLYAVWKENVLEDQTVSFTNSSVTKTYGDADFANVASTTGNGNITYRSSNTAVATVSNTTGIVVIKGAGTATITATAAATTAYNEGSATYTLTVKKANRTVSFSDVTVNKKYGDASFTNTATRTGDGDMVYSSSNTDVAEVNSSTGKVTIKGVGIATITANVAATDNYKAGSASYVLNVAKGSSSASFANATVTKTYGDANFTNTATASSDGTITYSSSNTAVATVNSSTGAVTIKGAGTATITANAAATSNYVAASATYSLTVNKANRTVSFGSNSVTKTYGDAAFTNAATRTGDGNIVYSSNNTNVAEINSSTGKVTIKSAGTATITANVAATDNYKAGSATYTLTVSRATPTVNFASTAVSKSYLDAKFTNAATTNSDGAISYSSNNTTVATVNSTSGEITIKNAGTATITASVAATNNYNTATATYTLTVGRYAPTITFANTTITKTYGDAKFTNAATTISDGAITYSSSNTAVAVVNNSGEVTIKGAGTATITANVSATTNHQAATTTYALTVNKKTSTAPEEASEVKTGYVTDPLSTITLNTRGLVWSNSATKIEEGHNGYAVSYTENGDSANYTTETFEITVNGERRVYGVTDGDGQTYILKSDQYTSFRLDADYSLFEEGGSVYIDDVLLDPQYYTAESGSTIISVSNNYLETLPVGDHTLSVYFNDGGVATATFAVAELTKEEEKNIMPVPNTASATGTPNTGSITDDEHGIGADLLVYALPIGLVVMMFVGGYFYRNKKAHRKFEW